MKKIFLNPARRLVDEVVAYIKTRARKGAPANYFDHLMIVVPTAESGRALRLALAKEFTAVLAPKVVLPMQLIVPEDKSVRLAGNIELQSAFLAFVKNAANDVGRWTTLFKKTSLEQNDSRAFLGFYEQLNEIWHALAGSGLSMQDVPANEMAREVLAQAEGLEQERWGELAEFEAAFFEYLEAHNLNSYALYIKKALAAPAKVDDCITEIILPALVDPVQALFTVLEASGRPVTVLVHADAVDAAKFDERGIPVPEAWRNETLDRIERRDIFCALTNAQLGEQVARAFCAGERPALGLVDADVFTDVQSALMNNDLAAYQPEQHPLRVSSLGEMLTLFVTVWDRQRSRGVLDWTTLAGLLRCDDVMRVVLAAKPSIRRERLLEEVDVFANKFMPMSEPTARQLAYRDRHTSFAMLSDACAALASMFDSKLPLPAFLRATLSKVFTAPPDDKEFVAAIHAVGEFIAELETQACSLVTDADKALIAQEGIRTACYQLEPDDSSVIKTLGWLELAWTEKAQVALAGFHEGSVPDALIGHAFLPNSLRVALGVTSNDRRFARDVYLLKALLASRAPHDVKFFVARANSSGDIRKPSRLLFLCGDDELPARVKHLFDELPVDAADDDAGERVGWTYNFPTEVPLPNAREGFRGSVSPSQLDQYLNSPFAYFLKYGLGMKSVKFNDELPANDYGSLAHAVLENFANAHKGRGMRPDEDAIRGELRTLCDDEFRRVYGPEAGWGTNLYLQLDSLRSRICAFAPIQREWAEAGWQVYAAEVRLNSGGELFPFAAHPDVALRGSVDRIDFHPSYGYRIIDYKTWDAMDARAMRHVFASDPASVEAARLRGLPVCELPDRRKTKPGVFRSIQLPLYARALEAKDPAVFKDRICDMFYLVLGKEADEVGAFLSRDGACSLAAYRGEADATVDALLDQLLANGFWDPTDNSLAWDFTEFFDAKLERNIDPAWIERVRIRPAGA